MKTRLLTLILLPLWFSIGNIDQPVSLHTIDDLMRIGEIQMFDRDYRSATSTFKEVLQRQPDHTEALSYVSEMYLVRSYLNPVKNTKFIYGRMSTKYASKLNEYDANDYSGLFLSSLGELNLGDLASQTNQNEYYEKANDFISQMGLNPNNEMYWYALGEKQLRTDSPVERERIKTALIHFENAISFNEKFMPARYRAFECAIAIGEQIQANSFSIDLNQTRAIYPLDVYYEDLFFNYENGLTANTQSPLIIPKR